MPAILKIISSLTLVLALGCGPRAGQHSAGVACVFDEEGYVYTHQSALSPDGTMWAWVNYKGDTLTITHLGSGKKSVLALQLGGEKLAFSPNAKSIAAANNRGAIVLLETATGRERLRLAGHEDSSVTELVFSPDGLKLASSAERTSSGDDHCVKVWSLIDEKCIASHRHHKHGRVCLSFGHDGKTLWYSDGTIVHQWDFENDTVKAQLQHPGVGAVAASPNGALIATGDYNRIKIWDAHTLNQKRELAPSGRIRFSPDGSFLAAGAHEDGAVHVWDLANNKTKDFQIGTKYPVDFAVLSGKHELVVPVSRDQVKRWDLNSKPWEEALTVEQFTEKRSIELKKQREELTARMRKEIDDVPRRIRKASDRKELNEALAPYRHHLVESDTLLGNEKIAADPAWRDDFLLALEEMVAGQDNEMAWIAAQLIISIPGEKTRKMIVDAFRQRKPFARVYTIGDVGLGLRLNEFSLEEQRVLVPLLLEKGRDGYMDTMLLKIPDARVLPAFFAVLAQVQNEQIDKKRHIMATDVSIALRELFHANKLDTEVPVEIRERGSITKDPLGAAELWRAWYKQNGKNLVWDEQALKYTLKR